VKTYADLYLDTRRALLPTEGEQAAYLARELISFVTGKRIEEILAERTTYANDEIEQALNDAVQRLLEGEPLAYILQQWEFHGMPLLVTRDVLIPRDDTEVVTNLAIRRALFLEQDPRILDLCTGSGCIGLAIAQRVKDARVTLADVSPEALAVARRNSVNLGLSGRVSCVRVDATQPAPAFLGKFDLIVSNPPYVSTREMQELEPSVRKYEPHLALHGGTDGLDFYRAITQNFHRALKPGGFLCYEFGQGQDRAVCQILIHNHFEVMQVAEDTGNIRRAVIAQDKREEA
jgi:release factor glutamine methyltransferase